MLSDILYHVHQRSLDSLVRDKGYFNVEAHVNVASNLHVGDAFTLITSGVLTHIESASVLACVLPRTGLSKLLRGPNLLLHGIANIVQINHLAVAVDPGRNKAEAVEGCGGNVIWQNGQGGGGVGKGEGEISLTSG